MSFSADVIQMPPVKRKTRYGGPSASLGYERRTMNHKHKQSMLWPLAWASMHTMQYEK